VKVTILTEGGRDIGCGHITRCTSIYQAFEEIGIQSQLIVNGDETIEDLLNGKNYEIFNWLDDQQLLFEILNNTNIVFIDSYLAEHDIYERISEQVERAAFFDDDLRIDYPKGFVLNGAIFAEQLPYPKKKGVTNLLGTMYTPIRREFWDVPPKLIIREIQTLMVTFGGLRYI
jgi:spore coat polysaccharide biosynthesis predicted glycosyltransferase SpsG